MSTLTVSAMSYAETEQHEVADSVLQAWAMNAAAIAAQRPRRTTPWARPGTTCNLHANSVTSTGEALLCPGGLSSGFIADTQLRLHFVHQLSCRVQSAILMACGRSGSRHQGSNIPCLFDLFRPPPYPVGTSRNASPAQVLPKRCGAPYVDMPSLGAPLIIQADFCIADTSQESNPTPSAVSTAR